MHTYAGPNTTQHWWRIIHNKTTITTGTERLKQFSLLQHPIVQLSEIIDLLKPIWCSLPTPELNSNGAQKRLHIR